MVTGAGQSMVVSPNDRFQGPFWFSCLWMNYQLGSLTVSKCF